MPERSAAVLALAPLLALARAPLCAASGGDERVLALESPAGPAALGADVAADPAGGAWVSWSEPVGEGEHALRVAHFDGERFGAAREVARGARWFLNWADFPALAARDGGGVLASWLVLRPASREHYDAFFALAPEPATAFGKARRLHQDETPAEHGFVSLAALGRRRFAAAWLDGSAVAGAGHGHGQPGSASTALRYVPLGADGAPETELVLDPRVCDCCPTAMARRASGELVVAYRDRSEEEVRDISFVRLPEDGSAAPSAPRSVHADGWTIPGCPVNGPALAARGELVAASWFTLGSDHLARVQVALLEPEAADFGAPRRIDEGTPEGRVDLAFLGDALYASWMERSGDHAEWLVRRVERAAEAELADPLLVAEVPLGRASGFLRMAAVGDELLAVWIEDGLRAARVRP